MRKGGGGRVGGGQGALEGTDQILCTLLHVYFGYSTKDITSITHIHVYRARLLGWSGGEGGGESSYSIELHYLLDKTSFIIYVLEAMDQTVL